MYYLCQWSNICSIAMICFKLFFCFNWTGPFAKKELATLRASARSSRHWDAPTVDLIKASRSWPLSPKERMFLLLPSFFRVHVKPHWKVLPQSQREKVWLLKNIRIKCEKSASCLSESNLYIQITQAPLDILLIEHQKMRKWSHVNGNISLVLAAFQTLSSSPIFPNDPPGTPMLIPKNALDFTKEGTMLPLQDGSGGQWLLVSHFRGLLHLCTMFISFFMIQKMICESFQLFS